MAIMDGGSDVGHLVRPADPSALSGADRSGASLVGQEPVASGAFASGHDPRVTAFTHANEPMRPEAERPVS